MPYQTLTRCLESVVLAPLEPREVFSYALGHSLKGIADINRHHYAGKLVGAKHLSESVMVEIAADQLRIDMNPFMQCMLRARTLPNALRLHQGLNEHLAVNTKVGFSNDGSLTIVSRTELPSGEDPVACRDAHLVGMDVILSNIDMINASAAGTEKYRRLALVKPPDRFSKLAQMLGLSSGAAIDVALAFESEPSLRVDALARQLGCNHRSLQREFKTYGITAEMIKRATMLSRATQLLPSALTLTEIAYEAGYSDHAHMTRAFVASCSLPPSILRQAFATPASVN